MIDFIVASCVHAHQPFLDWLGSFFGHTDCAVLASVERVYEWVCRQTNDSACPPVCGLLGQKKVLAHSSNHIASKVPVRPNYSQRKNKTTERTL